jgi:hypothetical protein
VIHQYKQHGGPILPRRPANPRWSLHSYFLPNVPSLAREYLHCLQSTARRQPRLRIATNICRTICLCQELYIQYSSTLAPLFRKYTVTQLLTDVQGSNQVTPLRNSRSHSALRDTTDIPPRPASTDNTNTNNTSAPFWLLVNGRLVWIEDLQLWVLWDDVVASQNLGAYYSQQQQRNQQQQQQRQSGRGIRTWKSLPPLPHEIHHLLPMPMDIGPSFDPNDRIQRRDHYYSQTSPTNARIQLQWASLAGQLGWSSYF